MYCFMVLCVLELPLILFVDCLTDYQTLFLAMTYNVDLPVPDLLKIINLYLHPSQPLLPDGTQAMKYHILHTT